MSGSNQANQQYLLNHCVPSTGCFLYESFRGKGKDSTKVYIQYGSDHRKILFLASVANELIAQVRGCLDGQPPQQDWAEILAWLQQTNLFHEVVPVIVPE